MTRPVPAEVALRAALLLIIALLNGCPTPRPAVGPGLRQADVLLSEGKALEAMAAYQTALDEPPKGHGLRGMGLCQEILGLHDKALTTLEQAREAMPDDAIVRLALSRLYVGAGKRDEALAQARYVYDHHPDNLTALIMLGALAQTPEEIQQAFDRLEGFRNDTTQKRIAVAELFVALSDLSTRKGDPRAAESARNESQRAPLGDVDGAVKMSGVYLKLGLGLAAEQLLLAVVRTHPKRIDAQQRLAFLASNLDHLAIADAALSTFESDPKKPDETILRAQVKFALGRADEALAELRDRVTRSDIDNPGKERKAKLRYWLGKSLTQTGDLQGAQQFLNAAIDVWPEMIPAHLALAELRLRERQIDQAIAGLDIAITKAPDAADLHGVLGSAYMTKGDYARAEKAYRRRAELAPKDPASPHLIGVALLAQHKDPEAIAEFRRALELDPAAIDPLDALASLLVSGGKQGEAEALYQRAVSAAPGRVEAWIAFAHFYLGVGNGARAAAVIQQALRQNPEHVGALTEAAQIAITLHNYAEAEQLSTRLVQLQPTLVPAWNNLAVLYDEHLNQADKALDAANHALALAPEDAHVQDTVGWVLSRRGEHDRAVELLAKSAATLSDRAVIQFHYGMALINAGKRDEGRAQLRKALALDSNFTGAAQARAAL